MKSYSTLDTFVNECSWWKLESANCYIAKGGGNQKIYLAGVFIFENCRLINSKTPLKAKKTKWHQWYLNPQPPLTNTTQHWHHWHWGHTGISNIVSLLDYDTWMRHRGPKKKMFGVSGDTRGCSYMGTVFSPTLVRPHIVHSHIHINCECKMIPVFSIWFIMVQVWNACSWLPALLLR